MSKRKSGMGEGDDRAWRHAMSTSFAPLVAESEIETILLAAATMKGTITEDEARELIEWAEGVRISQGLLDTVLSGGMLVSMEDGKPMFKQSESGKAEAEARARSKGLPIPDVR